MVTPNANQRKELATIMGKVNELGLKVRYMHGEDDAPEDHPLWQASHHIMLAVEQIDKFLHQ